MAFGFSPLRYLSIALRLNSCSMCTPPMFFVYGEVYKRSDKKVTDVLAHNSLKVTDVPAFSGNLCLGICQAPFKNFITDCSKSRWISLFDF